MRLNYPAGRPPGVVQRIVVPGYSTQWRTRDPHDPDSWGWGDRDDAFIFESLFVPTVSTALDYEKSAEFHAATLKAAGEAHVHPVAWGTEYVAERALRRKNRDTAMEASVAEVETKPAPSPSRRALPPKRLSRRASIAPAQAYERMEREHLA